jgi:hypothetical protein
VKRAPDPARRTAVALALAAGLLYALSGGGRIVGSDEVTMFQLSRVLLAGRIAVPEGATLAGRDGRFYTKNSAGQAVIALPLVAIAEGLSRAAGPSPARRELAARAIVSLFNAVVAALLLAAFYLGARRLGIGARAALAAGAMLGFTTPLWVYAKSFMAEPLESLGLFLALVGAARAAAGEARAARGAALGAGLAIAAKLSMLPLALACLIPLAAVPRGERLRLAAWPAAGVVLALLSHVVYDVARFGTPFETGYGAQASLSAYTTPLLVGLYGLLISSGKGVMWFAPALWLAPAGWLAMARGARAGEPRSAAALAARGAVLASALALGLYATFQHWAGDGSWGPRYLVPLLPLAFLAVATAIDAASRARRRLAWTLALAGLVVQIAGVSIHFGAQMREAGDYPYRLQLADPRFMSESHFNPASSPIRGHWRMLLRNLGEHLRGELPRVAPEGGADARLGVGEADQRQLLHALDFGWTYALYAGVPPLAVFLAVAALLALAGWALLRLRRAFLAETRAP